MIPPELELRAREMVLEAAERGGELWQHVSPATVELLIEAVAQDIHAEADRENAPALPPHLGLRRDSSD